jgi:hypothetical protein
MLGVHARRDSFPRNRITMLLQPSVHGFPSEFTDGSKIESHKTFAAFGARAQIRIVLTVPERPHQDWRDAETCGSSVVYRQRLP